MYGRTVYAPGSPVSVLNSRRRLSVDCLEPDPDGHPSLRDNQLCSYCVWKTCSSDDKLLRAQCGKRSRDYYSRGCRTPATSVEFPSMYLQIGAQFNPATHKGFGVSSDARCTSQICGATPSHMIGRRSCADVAKGEGVLADNEHTLMDAWKLLPSWHWPCQVSFSSWTRVPPSVVNSTCQCDPRLKRWAVLNKGCFFGQ